jgi:ABC-type multidrug transport system ATPase subunit
LAVELLSDPQVVALDEPTSGQDSLTSFIIVNELKTLALSGKTIFLTIHQPSTEIYALFDTLLLMAEGRMVYQGSAETALDYFERHFNLVCPEIQNPAEFFMSVLHSGDSRNTARYEQYF